jgi:Tfp pilus tip-associated adhesin PilY1
VYFGDTQGRINRVDLTSGSLPNMRPVRFFDPTDVNCRADVFGHANTPIVRAADEVQVATLPFPNLTDPGPIYERALIAKDRVGRRMLFVGTGDFTNPTSTNDVNHFYAVRDSETGSVCSGTPAWIKRFSPGEKVLADPVVIGATLILSTYKPPTGGTSCTDAGSATLYAYEMATGRPANVISDGHGHNLATLTIPGTGIISDLLVSGSNLVFNTSNDPTRVQTVRLNVASGMALKSWRRLR